MTHVVLSTNTSGAQQTDEYPSLEAALEQVEHLRNDGDVTDVRVLREIPIEVKTYYKVVALDESAGGADDPVAEAVVAPEPAVEEAPEPSFADESPVTPLEALEPPAAPAADHLRVEPPSGAAVFSPPPVVTHQQHEDGAENQDLDHVVADRRSSLFGRG